MVDDNLPLNIGLIKKLCRVQLWETLWDCQTQTVNESEEEKEITQYMISNRPILFRLSHNKLS